MTPRCDTSEPSGIPAALLVRPSNPLPRHRSAHLLLRGRTWYWRRRLPGVGRGTKAKIRQAEIRVSLRTEDRRTALARALQLDATFEKLARMADLTSTLTTTAFAAEVRRSALTELETRRANRELDEPGSLTCWQPGPPLDSALATRLSAFAAAPDMLGSDLPADLAADLQQALKAVPRARHWTSPLAASEARAQATDGRAAPWRWPCA